MDTKSLRKKIFNKCYRHTRKEFNIAASAQNNNDNNLIFENQSQVFASTSFDSTSVLKTHSVPDLSDFDESGCNIDITENNMVVIVKFHQMKSLMI